MFKIRYLGIRSYLDVWNEMKHFTLTRDKSTADELWLLEHFAIYTQGQAGKAEHILNPHTIPVLQTDRGGQVTYHAPGQLVAYVLIDLYRRQMTVRALIVALEKILIKLLTNYEINAYSIIGAPGVYIDGKKIASIGLRVKRGCTYHGIALNVAMDLTPFNNINPCGFTNLKMTQLKDYCAEINFFAVREQFVLTFVNYFEL